MDEQQPAEASPGASSGVPAQPAAASSPEQVDRRAMVIAGGLVAGFGLSIAVGFLMHVVQEMSPYGAAISITGSVWLEILVAGPVFGLGLALALTAVFPSAITSTQHPSAEPASATDDPADV
jgi:hypothetical protein